MNNTVLTLAIGSRRLITNDILAYVDMDNDPKDLFYTINNSSQHGQFERVDQPGKALFRLWQVDINQGKVVFSHFGSKLATSLTFELSISDGQSKPHNLIFKIVAFQGSIKLAVNSGLGVRYKSNIVITSANLTAATTFDVQQPKPTVMYTIIHGPHTGYVALSDNNGRLERSSTFTQKDINASRVYYVHNSSNASTQDSMSVQLSSSFFTQAAKFIFPIHVTLPAPSSFPRLVVTTHTIVVKEGGSAFITDEHLHLELQPHLLESGPLQVAFDSPFKFGLVIITHPRHPPTQQTEFGVEALLGRASHSLTYIHDGSESKTDNVTFCVRATGVWPPEIKAPTKTCGHILSVKILPVNDQPPKVCTEGYVAHLKAALRSYDYPSALSSQ